MPHAMLMIANHRAIAMTIVLMKEAIARSQPAGGVVIVSIVLPIVITYYMMKNSDYII